MSRPHRLLLCLMVSLLILPSVLGAWSLPGIGKGRGNGSLPFLLSNQPDYQIIYSVTGRKINLAVPGEPVRVWSEVSYKIIYSSENPSAYFNDFGLAHVKLKDREGFTLASDIFHRDELSAAREYYGFLWMKEAAANKVSGAEIQALPEDQALFIQKERIRSMEEIRLALARSEERLHAHSAVFNQMEEALKQKAAARAQAALAPPPNPEPQAVSDESRTTRKIPGFGTGVITNEVIQKALQEHEKPEGQE